MTRVTFDATHCRQCSVWLASPLHLCKRLRTCKAVNNRVPCVRSKPDRAFDWTANHALKVPTFSSQATASLYPSTLLRYIDFSSVAQRTLQIIPTTSRRCDKPTHQALSIVLVLGACRKSPYFGKVVKKDALNHTTEWHTSNIGQQSANRKYSSCSLVCGVVNRLEKVLLRIYQGVEVFHCRLQQDYGFSNLNSEHPLFRSTTSFPSRIHA